MKTVPKQLARRVHAGARPMILGLIIGWLSAPLAFSGDPGKALTVSTDKGLGLIKVSYGNQPLMVYAFGTNQFKPYVQALYSLAGDNVLLDGPPDHLHHHGLMYAITVNGINFWEEAVEPGYQRTLQAPSAAVSVRPDGAPLAVIGHTLYWVAKPEAQNSNPEAAALLLEERTLSVSVTPASQEVALEWSSDFKVGRGAARVTLSGSDYHGLGVRFPRSWDRVARHANSANAPYLTQGKRDVIEARWSAVAHTGDDRTQTFALFAHPANKGPSKFFSMLDPFTYLSATQGLDKEKLDYSTGDTFRVGYLVAVYSASKPPEALAQRYRQWSASTEK